MAVEYALVVIDATARFVWTAPLPKEEAGTEKTMLRRVIDGVDKVTAFINSDQGNEFTGNVDEMLRQKCIIHKSSSCPNNMNVHTVVDRDIQTKRVVQKT